MEEEPDIVQFNEQPDVEDWILQGVGDGQRSLACCNPWGHKESDTNEQLN